ncbi:hypothetical protein [Streptomyces sp. NPDC002088]|uniref:hypothetical protein n=1 Tax=Streptomyces sp. NPDC002088 TaxID=3154665 RepID=UPI00332122B7
MGVQEGGGGGVTGVRGDAEPGQSVPDGCLVGDEGDVRQSEQPGEDVMEPVGLAVGGDARGQALVEGAQ